MSDRFRESYRILPTDEYNAIKDAKNLAEEIEAILDAHAQDPRYKALALTALEESIMWAVKSITAVPSVSVKGDKDVKGAE